MKTAVGFLLLLPLAAGACAPATNAGAIPDPADMPRAMEAVMRGTIFTVQLDQPVGGPRSMAPGGVVTATVIEPLLSPAGAVVIPVGATVEGIVNGHQRPVGIMPGLIDVEFRSVTVRERSYPFTGWVVHADLAITDDAETLPAGIASVTNPSELFPGTVVSDPEAYLEENELGPDPNSVISLGWEEGATLPAGARLTVEFARSMSV